jgi:RNA polymerase sigma-70 factor, ECF subfamily
MVEFPETRLSLVARLKNVSDHDAWGQFSELYVPAIFRLSRRFGLQSHDADDLAQGVFVSVAKSVKNWVPDPKRPKFRAWLWTIIRNALLNAIDRAPPDAARGGGSDMGLSERPTDEDPLAEQFEIEYRRQMFRRAAAEVAGKVEVVTWRAFWLTAVDGKSSQEAAEILGINIGSVHTARSRVIRRLHDCVQEWEREEL